METLFVLIVQIVTGIIGGMGVGVAMKQAAIGQITRIISGAIGGVAGGTVLASLLGGVAEPASGLAVGDLLTNIAGGVGGGGILTAAVGFIMKAMDKS